MANNTVGLRFFCNYILIILKRVKSMSVLNNIEITHLFDYESNEDVHTVQFIKTLDLLKESSKLGKQLKYHLAYSNFTFELWMVLHKADCNTSFAHRREYLGPINRAYTEYFENLDEYKNQTVFKRVLGKISLSDVKAAINRAKIIMQRNKENGLKLEKYKGYEYYKDNPSLSVGDSLEKILKDCGL